MHIISYKNQFLAFLAFPPRERSGRHDSHAVSAIFFTNVSAISTKLSITAIWQVPEYLPSQCWLSWQQYSSPCLPQLTPVVSEFPALMLILKTGGRKLTHVYKIQVCRRCVMCSLSITLLVFLAHLRFQPMISVSSVHTFLNTKNHWK